MAALAALSPDETADELRLSGQTLRLPLLPYSKLMGGTGQQETEDGSKRMRETPRESVFGLRTSDFPRVFTSYSTPRGASLGGS